MAAPFIVTVDAEYGSEWYLTPWGFSTYTDALRYAAGIAKGWEGRSGTPAIWIKGAKAEGPWSVEALVAVGFMYKWFDPPHTAID
jgi:hypothetical protein